MKIKMTATNRNESTIAGWGSDIRRFPEIGSLAACVGITLSLAGLASLVLPDFVDLEKIPAFGQMTKIMVVAFFFPALFEELIFRGLLNSYQTKRSIIISTLLFILWHPVAAYLFIPPALPTMLDPRFLVFVAIFGVAFCLMRKWTGSLWTPILCHWLLTVIWKGLGGAQFLT